MYSYPALFEPCDDLPGCYTVIFPDVPGGVTQGDDLEDAKRMAADALEVILSAYIEDKQPIPKPSKRQGKLYHPITVSALAAAKLALYEAMREAGMSKAELGRQLGIPKQNVDRLFDLQHNTRIDQIERGLALFGKRLTVGVEDAA